MKKYFTTKENNVLTEVYRRLNVFHKGNVEENLLLLCNPSYAKPLVKLGIIKSFSKEQPRMNNWYNLTYIGKRFFKNYIQNISDDMNEKMFTNQYVKNFDYSLFLKVSSNVKKV